MTAMPETRYTFPRWIAWPTSAKYLRIYLSQTKAIP